METNPIVTTVTDDASSQAKGTWNDAGSLFVDENGQTFTSSQFYGK